MKTDRSYLTARKTSWCLSDRIGSNQWGWEGQESFRNVLQAETRLSPRQAGMSLERLTGYRSQGPACVPGRGLLERTLGISLFSAIALSEAEPMPAVPNIVMPFFFPQSGRQQAGDVTACHSCGTGKCSAAYQRHMTAPNPPNKAGGIQAINADHTL